MEKILLATENPTKVEGLKKVLEGLNFSYLTIDDILERPEFEESGETFEENAIIKAVEWSKKVGCLTIASDSGVIIPALGNNWNELLTHRFAGKNASETDRIEALVELMKTYKGEQRLAFFRVAIAIAMNGNKIISYEVEGDRGIIAETFDNKIVKHGDWLASIWFYPEFGKTYYELSGVELLQVNNGWKRLKEKVQNFFNEAK